MSTFSVTNEVRSFPELLFKEVVGTYYDNETSSNGKNIL